MPENIHTVDDDKEHIITVRDDNVFGYKDVIDKIMHRKEPYVNLLLRKKEFPIGIYRIRNGQTKRLTEDEIQVLDIQKVMWLALTEEQVKNIMGVDRDVQLLRDYKTYMRALRLYFNKHEMAFSNHPIMYLHTIKPIPRSIQQKLV